MPINRLAKVAENQTLAPLTKAARGVEPVTEVTVGLGTVAVTQSVHTIRPETGAEGTLQNIQFPAYWPDGQSVEFLVRPGEVINVQQGTNLTADFGANLRVVGPQSFTARPSGSDIIISQGGGGGGRFRQVEANDVLSPDDRVRIGAGDTPLLLPEAPPQGSTIEFLSLGDIDASNVVAIQPQGGDTVQGDASGLTVNVGGVYFSLSYNQGDWSFGLTQNLGAEQSEGGGGSIAISQNGSSIEPELQSLNITGAGASVAGDGQGAATLSVPALSVSAGQGAARAGITELNFQGLQSLGGTGARAEVDLSSLGEGGAGASVYGSVTPAGQDPANLVTLEQSGNGGTLMVVDPLAPENRAVAIVIPAGSAHGQAPTGVGFVDLTQQGSLLLDSTGNTVTVTDTRGNSATLSYSFTRPAGGSAPQPAGGELSLSIAPSTILETETATATVTRTGDLTDGLVVTLQSDNTDAATVPAQITIPADQSTATFTVTATDDSSVDGTETAIITASAALYTPDTATVSVENDDTADTGTVTVTFAQSPVNESDGVAQGTLTRSGTTATNKTFDLRINIGAQSRASVPSQVTIPIGQASQNFNVSLVDNDAVDGDFNITVFAQSSGYPENSGVLQVLEDDDLPANAAPADTINQNFQGPDPSTLTPSTSDSSYAGYMLVAVHPKSQLNNVFTLSNSSAIANASPRFFDTFAAGQNAAESTAIVYLRTQLSGGVAGEGYLAYNHDGPGSPVVFLPDPKPSSNTETASFLVFDPIGVNTFSIRNQTKRAAIFEIHFWDQGQNASNPSPPARPALPDYRLNSPALQGPAVSSLPINDSDPRYLGYLDMELAQSIPFGNVTQTGFMGQGDHVLSTTLTSLSNSISQRVIRIYCQTTYPGGPGDEGYQMLDMNVRPFDFGVGHEYGAEQQLPTVVSNPNASTGGSSALRINPGAFGTDQVCGVQYSGDGPVLARFHFWDMGAIP